MASDLETMALKAFINYDFERAVQLLTLAISFTPNDAELFAERAEANLSRCNFNEAVADASRAIELDPSMHKAYFPMGDAFYELGKYQNAKEAWELGSSLAPTDARFTDLIKRCDERIAGIRQVLEEVVVTILAKGIPAQDVMVHFGKQSLSVIIHVPGEDAYYFQPCQFGKIAPDKCRYEVLPSKIDVHHAKAEPLNWTSLDRAIPHKVTVGSDVRRIEKIWQMRAK